MRRTGKKSEHISGGEYRAYQRDRGDQPDRGSGSLYGPPSGTDDHLQRDIRFATERGCHAIWRQQALACLHRLELEVPEGPSEVRDLLDLAWDAAVHSGGLRDWWEGTLVERTWRALHDAEVAIVRRLPGPEAVLWWQAATGGRPKTGLPWSTVPKISPADAAYAAAVSLRAYYDESDLNYEEARGLRNRLIKLTAAGVAGTGLLLLSGALGVLRVAASASAAAAVSGLGEFLMVALFGAVGAFISGMRALSASPRPASPYYLASYQLMLKLALGPVFALLGVLAIQSSFADQLTPFKSFGGAVLLWAAIFGGAQQLLTGILDRKASAITPPVEPPANMAALTHETSGPPQ
jgi:hypothetical protein